MEFFILMVLIGIFVALTGIGKELNEIKEILRRK